MALFKASVFLAVQTLLYAIFVSRSPYTMVTTAPTKTWADGPMRLITTPRFETKQVGRHTLPRLLRVLTLACSNMG